MRQWGGSAFRIAFIRSASVKGMITTSRIAPGVTTHSIIAVQGTGDLSALNDGVVRYQSAHLEGVESEKIVQSSHSMQSQPDTILEVRRILREHLGIP